MYFNTLHWAYYCLGQTENVFFDSFDVQKPWKTVALMVGFNNLQLVYYCLHQAKNVFFDSFDVQKLWKTVALMVSFNSFNFSRLIYRIFIVPMFCLIWLKKIFSSSIY